MSSQSNVLEQQNNQRLEELSRKVTSLRNVTIDIHSQASDQSYIDQGGEILSRFSTSVKDSAGKLTRMISTNSPRRIPSMVGIFLLAFFFIYWMWPTGSSSPEGV